MLAVPEMTETTSSWPYDSKPRTYATGTLAIAANRTRSIAIITGRLARCSTHGPSENATTAATASPAASRSDTANAGECSTRTAISGNAPKAIHVPYVLTA